jgi:hypothetical protein
MVAAGRRQRYPPALVRHITAEMRSGATVVSSSDTIILEGPSDVIFVDGFEAGNTSSWSVVAQ